MSKIDFASKRKIVSVEIPWLEETFRLRIPSYGEVRNLPEGKQDDRSYQLALSIVDGDGRLIYDVANPDDIANLDNMDARTSSVLTKELNGLWVTGQAARDNVKNS